MKPWILISLLSLSLSALSRELEFESFSQENRHHLKEIGKFCEQMKSLGFSSNLFSENCDLAYDSKRNTKDISLVYDKTDGKLISILKTQFVRSGTTALLSASFLIDFSRTADIYKAMFERIQELSRTDESWNAISWVAIHREIFHRVPGLDEKLFPILFSFEDQLFAASSILNFPEKKLLEPMKVCETSSYWPYVAPPVLTALAFFVIKIAKPYWSKQPQIVSVQQEEQAKPVIASPRSPKILPAEPSMRSGTPPPNPETQMLVRRAQDLMKQVNNIKRGKSNAQPSPVKIELKEIKTKLTDCLHAGEDVSSVISQIGGCLRT